MFWSLACLGLGLRFFEVASRFDGIGDRTFYSGIDSAEDVVFLDCFLCREKFYIVSEDMRLLVDQASF